MAGSGSPDAGAGDAKWRRQRDDERARGPEVDVIKQAPGFRRDGQTPLASCGAVRHHRPPQEVHQHVGERPDARHRAGRAKVRDEATIVEGRMFEFGTNEVVVGRGAQRAVAGLTVGDELRSGQNRWQVVGIFEADGGVAETEVWCDVRVLQGAYRRGNTYQSVLAQLDSTDSFDDVSRLADLEPSGQRAGAARDRLLRRSSRGRMTSLIQGMGFGIAALMGIGAVSAPS